MRESMGGAWLFGIVIIFVFLFSGFLAYSISYTKAFNLKNKIVNLIEEFDGYSEGENEVGPEGNKHKSVETMSKEYVEELGYNYGATQDIKCIGTQVGGSRNEIKKYGYCVVKYCTQNNDGALDDMSNTHYKITTYIALKLPVVNLTAKIPISGETRTIYSDTGGYPCTGNTDLD